MLFKPNAPQETPRGQAAHLWNRTKKVPCWWKHGTFKFKLTSLGTT